MKAVESGSRRQMLIFRKLQECLLEVREVGNAKLQISAQMLDTVSGGREGLVASYTSTDGGGREGLVASYTSTDAGGGREGGSLYLHIAQMLVEGGREGGACSST